ncbi:MAG: response regulator [Candidatus Saganbacteria bacterium]|nr:response regulator [Candidatus Saganbacteria bacterium]
MMKTVLVVDDEKDIVEAIEYNLSKEGYKVHKAFDGDTGLLTAQNKLPDIVILDLMLPKMDGTEVCKRLKKDAKTANIPVIMLTAKSEETDKIVGLEIGADDYMTKPFSMRELLARIKAILKRYGTGVEKTQSILKYPGLEIDVDQHIVTVIGKKLELTAKEFLLLKYLAENKERVYSRDKLLDSVWGIDAAIETRTVDVHMRRLREKLKSASHYLKTLHGVGYKFSEKS